MDNDISLLQLSKPLSFNNYVGSIGLQGLKEYVGDCVVSGWGATYEGGSISAILNFVNVTTITLEACEDEYGENNIADNQICALVPGGGKDFCLGDAGGPLVCGGLLTGIVSWGFGCGHADAPGVYAEVAYFKDWVEKNVQ